MIGTPQGRTRVAAFFDVDGTLVAHPSLERRFFRMLRYRQEIPLRNYLLWLADAVRLAPRGMTMIAHANKMYLRGVRSDSTSSVAYAAKSQGATRVPIFFPKAVERIAWHAAQEHSIVLVTGTLAPLAQEVALALTLRLAVRGIPASIGVCATRPEEAASGRWTGRVIGDAMFGPAKAGAVQRLAAQAGFDLPRCYAYGDTASDRWMLGAVGRPAAVNPSRELGRIARLLDWPVLRWGKKTTEVREDTGYASIASHKTESLG